MAIESSVGGAGLSPASSFTGVSGLIEAGSLLEATPECLVLTAADGLDVWLIRGDPAAGGYVPDTVLPAFAARIGEGHVLTLAGAPHAPQRTHPEATTSGSPRDARWTRRQPRIVIARR